MHGLAIRTHGVSAMIAVCLLLAVSIVIGAPPASAAVTSAPFKDFYTADFGSNVNIVAPGIVGNDFGVSSADKAELIDADLQDGVLAFHRNGSSIFLSAAGPTSLPNTGFPTSSTVALALLLILIGAATVFLYRRRIKRPADAIGYEGTGAPAVPPLRGRSIQRWG